MERERENSYSIEKLMMMSHQDTLCANEPGSSNNLNLNMNIEFDFFFAFQKTQYNQNRRKRNPVIVDRNLKSVSRTQIFFRTKRVDKVSRLMPSQKDEREKKIDK